MKKIYALKIEDVDLQDIIEQPAGILIDDGLRDLCLKGARYRNPRTGQESCTVGRSVGTGFLSKIWDCKKAERWLKEHFPRMNALKWLEFEAKAEVKGGMSRLVLGIELGEPGYFLTSNPFAAK